jgi:hypothetical protein
VAAAAAAAYRAAAAAWRENIGINIGWRQRKASTCGASKAIEENGMAAWRKRIKRHVGENGVAAYRNIAGVGGGGEAAWRQRSWHRNKAAQCEKGISENRAAAAGIAWQRGGGEYCTPRRNHGRKAKIKGIGVSWRRRRRRRHGVMAGVMKAKIAASRCVRRLKISVAAKWHQYNGGNA